MRTSPRQRGGGATPDEAGGPTTRERILAAAEAVFAESGFAGGTTRRIAETAGVPEGLIFHYFKSKRGLLDALLAERSLGAELSELAVEVAQQRDPRKLLLALGRRFHEGLRRHEAFARIVLTESYFDETVRERLQRMQAERIDLIARAIDDATPRSIDPVRARTIAGMFLGHLMLAMVVDPPEDVEGFLTASVDVLLGPALGE